MKPFWIVVGVGVVLLFILAGEGRLFQRGPALAETSARAEAAGDRASTRLKAIVPQRDALAEDRGDPSLQKEIGAAYDEAAREYQQAYGIAPSAAILVKLGHLHLAVGDIGQARRAFVEALTRWPGTPSAYAGLGDTLSAFGDYRGAIENYQNALWWQANGTPDGALDVTGARLSLAGAFGKLHLPSAAIEQYEAVLVDCPGSTEALGGIFRVHVSIRQWAQALTALERWHAAAPDDPVLVVEVRRLASTNPEMELPGWADVLKGASPTSP